MIPLICAKEITTHINNNEGDNLIKLTVMKYTAIQIERAKRIYVDFLKLKTIKDYNLSVTSINEAQSDMVYHNNIVKQILAGNKELEREHKMSCLNIVLMNDQKEEARKEKLAANKEASADVLTPIKAIRKIGAFGKWLNTSGNPYRSQNFSKKYTQEAVDAFLATL